jgi:acetate---CoA ligase (ADP-forming)
VAELSEKYAKPVALCVSTEQSELSRLHKEFEFPIFLSPERAVRALDSAIRLGQRRHVLQHATPATPSGPQPEYATVQAVLQKATAEKRDPLLHEAIEILQAIGLETPRFAVVKDREAVVGLCEQMAGPYAVKVIAEGISHKTDVRGVALGVVGRDDLIAVVDDFFSRFGSQPAYGFSGVLVQGMAERTSGSVELIIGAKRDPQFGPIVMLGHGGILVELLGKTSLRMAPLADTDVDEMIDELPGSQVLNGVRGLPPVNREALRSAIIRVGLLMERFPEIESLDINPVLATETGIQALDARIVFL